MGLLSGCWKIRLMCLWGCCHLWKIMVFGEVPDDWADVTPNFKKGQKEDLGNHRLISPTSVLRKIVEHIHFWTHEGQVVIRSSQQIYQSKSHLWRQSWTEYWAALKDHDQQVKVGWWLFPSIWHLWGYIWNTSLTTPFLPYVLRINKILTYYSESWGGSPGWLGGARLVQSGEEKATGRSDCCFLVLNGKV